MNESPKPESSSAPNNSKRQPVERFIESTELFQGDTEITILHNGQPYRLRCTKNGKLILNK